MTAPHGSGDDAVRPPLDDVIRGWLLLHPRTGALVATFLVSVGPAVAIIVAGRPVLLAVLLIVVYGIVAAAMARWHRSVGSQWLRMGVLASEEGAAVPEFWRGSVSAAHWLESRRSPRRGGTNEG